jgi:hypothetical protein
MQNVPKIVRERLKTATPAVNHPDADALTAFAEHSLAGLERDLVLEHLARCGDCREVVALALPATEPVQTVVSPSSSPSGGWLTWPALRWAFVAAGLVAIASFGILQYQKSMHPTMVANRFAAPQAATTEAKNQLPAPESAEKRDKVQAPPALGDSISGANLMVMQGAGPGADSNSNSKKTAAHTEAVGRTGPTGSIGSRLGDQKSFGPRVANQFQQQNIAQNQAPAPAPPVAFGKEQGSARSSADVLTPSTTQAVEASGAAPQVAQAQSLNQNLDPTLAQNEPAVQPPSSGAYAFEKMSRAKLPVPPGQIGGYVVDPSGAVVPNAHITLIPSKPGQTVAVSAVTNSQGLWLIAGIPTGSYKAQAEAPGFRTTVASVNYDANQPSMYSFTLNIGSVAETVEVAAQNGQIQTDTTASVTDGQVSQIPVNGRRLQLTTLSSGVLPLWAINATGALRRSVDQGKSWQDVDVTSNSAAIASLEIASGIPRAKAKQTAKDLGQQPATLKFWALAAAGAEVWAGGSGGALYHSADAGNHWTRVVPAAAGTMLTGDITSLDFPDPQHGKLATTTTEVWTTSDGGQTWQKQ